VHAPSTPTVASTQSASAAATRPALGGRAELTARLLHELALAGPGSGAYVYDLTTQTPVFSIRALVGRPPASVEKLFTSVALLSKLGPQGQLQTRVLGRGSLGAGGVWHGNLYLRGGGDPTLGSAAFSRVWLRGYGATVSDLALQLKRHGIRRVTGSVIGDASQFDQSRGGPSTNFGPDLGDLGGELSALTYNHGESGGTARGAVTPGAYAAEQLALALHAVNVQAAGASVTGIAPRDATTLAAVNSPPVSVLLQLMNVPSDDFFAEMLTKELGARFGGKGTIPAGTVVITDALTAYGVHARVAVGSGLSRHDRTSPREVVSLLGSASSTPHIGQPLQASLPLVGVNGTTRRIARGTSARGRCQAKTGTLDYVTNLAGYCSAAGGQQLVFAIFVDGPTNEAALAIEGRMVADMVRLNAAQP
jgi:D-alanyl-D-alanine carboxypeptidase/D-alanyl-D-alanine-endopeptidase (penicillin-binding protein 4)